jgi:DNA-binding response OmpR family regulator
MVRIGTALRALKRCRPAAWPLKPGRLAPILEAGRNRVARLKVLVVEDEPVQLRILTAGLAAEGFDVVVARDAVQAVGMVRKEQPALVLLDIGLPGGDGYVVLQRLKNLSQSSVLPVIAVSARPAETERDKMLSMGADDYFQTPVTLPVLVARINELLAVPH